MHILSCSCDRFVAEMCTGMRLPVSRRFVVDSTKSICFGPASVRVSHFSPFQAAVGPTEWYPVMFCRKMLPHPLHLVPKNLRYFQSEFYLHINFCNGHTSSNNVCSDRNRQLLAYLVLYVRIASSNALLDRMSRNSAIWMSSHLGVEIALPLY